MNEEVADLEKRLLAAITSNLSETVTKKEGSTADDKSIDDNSMNIKSSTFNPYGPTSIVGPTSNPFSISGPTSTN